MWSCGPSVNIRSTQPSFPRFAQSQRRRAWRKTKRQRSERRAGESRSWRQEGSERMTGTEGKWREGGWVDGGRVKRTWKEATERWCECHSSPICIQSLCSASFMLCLHQAAGSSSCCLSTTKRLEVTNQKLFLKTLFNLFFFSFFLLALKNSPNFCDYVNVSRP